MKELTVRLAAVAAMVRDGARVADIGTDHALLPVWLIKDGRCPFAVASDIGEGPAASARRTVAEAGLESAVSVRVGDGLASVTPHEVEDIVIAGMGGETIADILAHAPWTKDARYHFVLQPMSKSERLRTFLAENGYAVQREEIVAEGERLYTVFSVSFTGECKTLTYSEAILGMPPRTEDGIRYVKKLGGRIAEHLAGLPKTDTYAQGRADLTTAQEAVAAWLKNG